MRGLNSPPFAPGWWRGHNAGCRSHRPDCGAPPRRSAQPQTRAAQDRLTQRTLFFRRVAQKPEAGPVGFGDWAVERGVAGQFVVGSELFRTLPDPLPTAEPSAQVSAPAPAVHHRFGLASLAADMGLRIANVQVTGAGSLDPASLNAAIGVQKGDPTLGFSPSPDCRPAWRNWGRCRA